MDTSSSLSQTPFISSKSRRRVDGMRQFPSNAEVPCFEKPKFIAAVSHDLRQLLCAMNLFNESLSQQIKDPLCLKLTQNMENTIVSMQMMIDSMLSVLHSEVVDLTPKFSRFNLDTILSRLNSEFAIQAQSKNVGWTCQTCDITLLSDGMLVEIALRNLIANALKYTDRGEVWVTCTATHHEQIAIAVGDTGIGIPSDQLPLIFREFYRLKPGIRTNPNGLGMGLSIVEKICKILGGAISIESTLGRGSVFTLVVPLTRNEPESLEKITVPTPNHSTATLVGANP